MHLFGNNRAATLSSSLKKLGYVGYYNPVSGTNPNRGINSAKPHCRRVKPELRRITLFGVIPTVWMQIVLKQRSKKILKKKKKIFPLQMKGSHSSTSTNLPTKAAECRRKGAFLSCLTDTPLIMIGPSTGRGRSFRAS